MIDPHDEDSRRDTQPPSAAEQDGLARFEEAITDAGEPSARLRHMVELLISGGGEDLRLF